MPTIDVAAGLIFRDGKVLLTQRYAHSHLGGLWEFPGGKREPRESFEECLRRELNEELGINVEVCELVQIVTHDYPGKRVHLQFYRCCLERGEPQTLECPAFRWVARKELGDYEFPEADTQLLKELHRNDRLWE